MAELGETNDPKVLIPGDPARVHEIAWTLRAHGDVLLEAGAGLKRIDTAEGWRGKAADQFRNVFDGQPKKWLEAGDCYHDASHALDAYESTLEWAQGQAADAIQQWNSAQAATSKAKADHARAEQQAQRSIPCTDPGQAGRQAAQDTLNRARNQLKSAGDTAADKVATARDKAPQQPGFWSKVGSGISSVASSAWHGAENLGATAVNDMASMGNAMLQHPGEAAAAAGGIGLTAVSGAGDGLGGVLDATGVGAVAGVPLNAVSTAGVVTGAGITGAATVNIAGHAAGDDHIEPLRTDHGSQGGAGGDEPPPGVKPGWESRPFKNGKGTVWQRPGARRDADSVRVGDPTPRYPNGYVRFYNGHNQPIDLNGKPTSQPETHIPRSPDGSYPLPKGW